jgi:hypothetical protein
MLLHIANFNNYYTETLVLNKQAQLQAQWAIKDELKPFLHLQNFVSIRSKTWKWFISKLLGGFLLLKLFEFYYFKYCNRFNMLDECINDFLQIVSGHDLLFRH